MQKRSIPFLIIVLCACAFLLSAAEPKGVLVFKKTWRNALKLKGDAMTEVLMKALGNVALENSAEAADAVMDYVFRTTSGLDGLVYDAAYKALRALGKTKGVVERYTARLGNDKNWRLRAALAKLLGGFTDKEDTVLPALHKALSDKKWQVQIAAVRSIRAFRSYESIPVLVEALSKTDGGRLASEISATLRNLTGVKLQHVDEWTKWFKEQKGGYEIVPEGTVGEEQHVTAALVNRLSTTPAKKSRLYGTVISKRVIFIVDISNSMNIKGQWGEVMGERSRLEVVKAELSFVIDEQLAPDSMFNIITFNHEVFLWKKSWYPEPPPIKAAQSRSS
jgi:hypothetical protein